MINNIINNTNSGINNNTNNNNRNGDNNNEGVTREDNLSETLRQWEQNLDHTTNYRSDRYQTNFRSGPVMVQQNYHSSHLTGTSVNNYGNYVPMRFNPKTSNNDMISNYNEPMDTNYSKYNQFTVNNNRDDFKTNDYSTSNLGTNNYNYGTNSYVNMNISNTSNNIGPVPVYKNYGGLDTSCHFSKVAAQEIQNTLTRMLETMLDTNELKIDFQVDKRNKYEFCGRIFTSSSTDFAIKIYKLKEKDNKGNISVIEIRNIFGDEFGFFQLEKLLLEKLENAKILLKQDDDKDSFGLDIIGSLTLDDDEDEEADDDDFDQNENNDNTTVDENDEEFDHNLCEIILETLYNKDSFREEYMHDAYQLATYLEKNDSRSKNMINYIVKNESKVLFEKLIEPLKMKKFFCAFIILHVLEAIDTLLSQEDIKSKLIIPENFMFDIGEIETFWNNDDIQTDIGPIRVKFVKSQQIERRCKSIIANLNEPIDE